MTAPLHPDLARIESHYNELVDQVQAGHLKIDDAIRSLENMQAIDGSGRVWKMDLEGNFVSGPPGTSLEVTPHVRFQPAKLPPRQTVPASPAPMASPVPAQSPWGPQGGSSLMTPPSGPNLDRSSVVTPPNPMLNNQFDADDLDFDDEEDFEAPTAKKIRAPKAKKTRSPKESTPLLEKVRESSLWAKIVENKRTVIVALLAVVVVAGIFFYNKSLPEDATPQGLPESSQGLGEMPTDGGAAPAGGEQAAAAALPDAGRIDNLVSSLVSGNRTTASAAVANPGDKLVIADQTARFGGFTDAFGLALTVGPAAAAEGGAVADFTVTDKESGETVHTGKVNFVLKDQQWFLASWPTIS